MKISLIAPAVYEITKRPKKPISFISPFNLAMLAALTPEDVEVTITDEEIQGIDFDREVDMVGITVYTCRAVRAYQIADAFRKKGVTVILGGFHPTFLPDEALKHGDSIVIGEAEETWPQLIKDFKNGALKRIYDSSSRIGLSDVPVPRSDLLKKENYMFPHQISIGRGCPFSCKFCSVTTYFGGTYRFRPIEKVLKEIEFLKNNGIRSSWLDISKSIHFIDDNIIAKPAYSKELFKAITPYKIKWVGAASLNIAEDDELLSLASKSGCIGLFIGIESINQKTLDSVRKKANTVERFENGIKRLHSYKISVQGSFIFGFDDDDDSVFERTVRFAQKVKLELAEFNILTPYPGTKVFEEMDNEGRLLTKDWSKYDNSRAVFKPKNMSPEMLENGTRWAWKEFYKTSSIYKRIGLIHPLLFSAWGLNLFTRSYYKDILIKRN